MSNDKETPIDRLNAAIEAADEAARLLAKAAGVKLTDEGIPLRDWFAGQYLASRVGGLQYINRDELRSESRRAAVQAYVYADEMMKAREETSDATHTL